MDRVQLDPYLFFRGNAREAMEFYKNVFGGELSITDVGDEYGGDPAQKEAMKGKVMHARLEGDVGLMGSDTLEASAKAAKIELSLSGDDEQKLRGYFDKLSEGGNVRSPLKKEAWGDVFGMLTDKFGIDWMVNINALKEQ